MYCMNCGKEISDGVKFCPYCGGSIKEEDTASNVTAQQNDGGTAAVSPSAENTGNAKGGKNRKIMWLVIAVCVVVVVVVAVVLVVRGGSGRGSSGNVLMQQSEPDDLDCVLGNVLYVPDDILTVTFLDTLEDMSSDAWDVSEARDGSVMAWVSTSSKYGGYYYDLYIAGKGGVDANPDSSFLFYDYTDMEVINFNDCFYTGNVTNMYGMFAECWDLESLDVSNWDTSNVWDMGSMFEGCDSLHKLDVSSWDTSSVTDMYSMFSGCWDLESLDVSGWDTSNVKDMSWMFEDCNSLRTLDVSGWDTSNVTDMCGMFDYCYCLESLDVSGWDTSNVTDMSWMFEDCYCLESLDVSGWDMSRADTWRMFSGTIWE